MRKLDHELNRIFDHHNFIASLGDETTCLIDLQAISRVLLIVARKLDATAAGPCQRCPYPRVLESGQPVPA